MTEKTDLNADVSGEYISLERPKRKLTHFMAHELIYDYVSDSLDTDRKRAFDEYLNLHPELNSEIDQIKTTRKYLSHLAKTRISQTHLTELSQIRPLSSIIFEKAKWKNWPDFLRWSVEGFSISIFVAVLAMIIPWDKIKFNVLESKPPAPKVVVVAPIIKVEAVSKVEPLPKVDQNQKVEPAEKVVQPKKVVAEEAPQPSALPPQTAPNQQVVSSNLAATYGLASKNSPKGLLYKVMMNLSDANKSSVEIKKQIEALGGTKAGQVELGWRKKNPPGNYFHFALPQGSYQKFLDELGKYGAVRIYKSPHVRIMPEGQIRIILFIEDALDSSEAKSKTDEQVHNPKTEVDGNEAEQ
ncbi:MAG: hypothetical protein ABL927_08230 [Bdellovibrionales bacterium]